MHKKLSYFIDVPKNKAVVYHVVKKYRFQLKQWYWNKSGPARERWVGCPLPLLAVGLGRVSAVFISGSVHVRVDVAATWNPAAVGTKFDFNFSIFQF